MPKTTDELSGKEAHFVDEYIIDKNATRSALAAGYSAKTAYSAGHNLKKKPRVAAAIKRALAEQQRRTLITADGVLKRLDRLAAKAEAAGDHNAAVRANQLLGQHYKLFTEKHEHGGLGGGPLVMQVTQTDEKL